MNNIRYLTNLTAAAGFLSAAVLTINALKRANVLPATSATQLVAPLAQAFAIVFVVGLWAILGRRSGALGLTATACNAAALSLVVGIEFVLNLVFPYVSPQVGATLRNGPLGAALLGASVFFLVASWLYVFALRTSSAPRAALALYAVGVVPVALRAALPAWTLPIGVAAIAAGVAWLSLAVLRRPTEQPLRAA